MPRKRRKPVPHTILWSIQDQRRFVDAVERMHGQVGDLVFAVNVLKDVVQDLERRQNAAKRAAETRRRRKEEGNGADTPLPAVPPADQVL